MQHFKFALSGAPCGGKTTTLWSVASELKKRGYNINIIQEQARLCPYPLDGRGDPSKQTIG
jgi:molybdopterin-guanine dinucleotide biosynthesis protein